MSTRAGRSDAEFEEFARARTPQLYRSAWLLCGDRHQADDLVQDTLAKVYAKWRSPFGGRIENPAAYAQTALTRTFLSARRRRSNTEVPLELTSESRHAVDAGSAELSETRLALLDALTGLAPADRTVLVLRYLEDLSVDEVAQVMGVSSGAVRNRSMRALARIRPLIDRSLVVTPPERQHP